MGQEFLWRDFWSMFLASTLENWQSEWLQLVFQAVLLPGAKHWIFKADAEDMERLEAKMIVSRTAGTADTATAGVLVAAG